MGVRQMPAPDWTRGIAVQENVRLSVRCFGAGNPRTVVLLHGNGEDYTCFRKQIGDFTERFRVITIDSRGHGTSDMADPFSLSVMADDLKRVLDALAIEKVMLVGFSDGGNIALLFSLRYQSRLEKLVLAGANLTPEGVARKDQRGIEFGYRICRLLGKISKKTAQKAKILGLMVGQPQIDAWELEAIEAPTLVLAGQRDLILPAHTKLIADSIPGAHLRIIPACDHFIFKNQPKWTNETIIRFLVDGKKETEE